MGCVKAALNQISICTCLSCGNAKAVVEGKEIHANLIRNGYAHDTFIGNLILQMYGKCEALEEAKKVFDRIFLPNIFSWSLIVLAFANWRKLDDALNIFNQMPEHDEVCWTSMITAFARHDRGEEAIQLFHQMQLHGIISDKVTFISMLDACASCQLLSQGKSAHCQVIQMDLALDIVVATALVNMYGKCCSMEDALAVFYRASRLDHILWTAVIAGCALNGYVKKAIHLFRQMQLENMALDNVTLGCILNECNGHLALATGKWMHAHILMSGFSFNVDLGSSVISMYGSCGTAADACNAFEKLPFQDLGSWNSMIVAYALHGHDVEAHKLFQQMQHEGSMPDGVTFVSILNASLSQTAVTQGKQVHAHIIASGLHKDVVVGTAILNMYGKCG